MHLILVHCSWNHLASGIYQRDRPPTLPKGSQTLKAPLPFPFQTFSGGTVGAWVLPRSAESVADRRTLLGRRHWTSKEATCRKLSDPPADVARALGSRVHARG